MKFLVANQEDVVGVNASSISEITAIPRATVIRKLKFLEKKRFCIKTRISSTEWENKEVR